MGCVVWLKKLLIGFLFLSMFFWIYLIFASFSLFVNSLLVLYFRFRWCGSVVLKYSSIMLFVLFFMSCVNGVKLFLMRFVLLAIQARRSWMLLFKCDNRHLASDRFFALNMFDIFFSKYLFKSSFSFLLCLIVFFMFLISFSMS